jgi:tetratricopeptide (TPR) repeat protein
MAVGRQWLGWLALRNDNAPGAARELAGAEASGWAAWASGKKAFRDHQYAEAAVQYRHAAEVWEAAKQRTAPSWIERLGPPVDLQAAYRELGSAELLAGHAQAAIDSFSLALKDQAPDARVLYLRARAKEFLGQAESAQTDYSLASRTAFAADGGTSGEAHLYRGILFYRRKDFVHAEDEFSSALNFEIAAPLRADASAWRQLAAVASGSCGASRVNLEKVLPEVSPYFPRDEARTRLNACATTSSARSGL